MVQSSIVGDIFPHLRHPDRTELEPFPSYLLRGIGVDAFALGGWHNLLPNAPPGATASRLHHICSPIFLVGGFNPSEKNIVKWDYCSQYMENRYNVPNHQPVFEMY